MKDLFEGGNVTQINYKTGEETRQERIPIQEIGVDNFRKKVIEMFVKLNSIFKKQHGVYLWADESIIKNGYAFNGSTSYVMDPKFIGDEIQAVKPQVGDIDITFPEHLGKELFRTLDSLMGKEIVKGVRYMGSNRTNANQIGDQINSVFMINFGKITQLQQVDFELSPFQGQKPSDWQKFRFGSSFDDAKKNIKAVNHKYLIRSVIGSQSTRDDIIIQTPSSTFDNIKFKKRQGKQITVENMTKFSVTHGVRVQYEPFLDSKGKPMYYSGPETGGKQHQIIKEIPTSKSTFQTEVISMFTLMFGDPKDNELSKMYSFIGIIELMKKYLDKSTIEKQNFRYQELLWGDGQQEIERGQPTWDLEVKLPAYEYFIKELGQTDLSKVLIDSYYSKYTKG